MGPRPAQVEPASARDLVAGLIAGAVIVEGSMQKESEMGGRDLLTDERRLFEDLCARDYLAA